MDFLEDTAPKASEGGHDVDALNEFVGSVARQELDSVLNHIAGSELDDETRTNLYNTLSEFGLSYLRVLTAFSVSTASRIQGDLYIADDSLSHLMQDVALGNGFLGCLGTEVDLRDRVLEAVSGAVDLQGDSSGDFFGNPLAIYTQAYRRFQATNGLINTVIDYLSGTAEDDMTPLFHALANKSQILALGSTGDNGPTLYVTDEPNGKDDAPNPEDDSGPKTTANSLMNRVILQRESARAIKERLAELGLMFSGATDKLENILEAQYGGLIDEHKARLAAIFGTPRKEFKGLSHLFNQGARAVTGREIHGALPIAQAEHMAQVIIAIDNNLVDRHGNSIRPVVGARRIIDHLEYEKQMIQIMEILRDVNYEQSTDASRHPRLHEIHSLSTAGLASYIGILIDQWDDPSLTVDNGLRYSARLHLGADSIERIDKLVYALRADRRVRTLLSRS